MSLFPFESGARKGTSFCALSARYSLEDTRPEVSSSLDTFQDILPRVARRTRRISQSCEVHVLLRCRKRTGAPRLLYRKRMSHVRSEFCRWLSPRGHSVATRSVALFRWSRYSAAVLRRARAPQMATGEPPSSRPRSTSQKLAEADVQESIYTCWFEYGKRKRSSKISFTFLVWMTVIFDRE